MKTELRAILRADAALVALTPGGIDWVIQRQGAPVANVVLSNISAPANYSIGGRLMHTTHRVQVDCYATAADEAQAIADAVLNVLDGYREEPFLGVLLIDTRDMRAGDENSVIHRVSMDFSVVHRG